MRQGEKPGKSKAETKRSVDRRSPKNDASGSRELEKRLAEALEQQRATSEILRVISSSPGDIQPVFDAIAANAARLCDAVNGLVIRFDGQLLHLAAHHNVDPERLAAVKQAYPRPRRPRARRQQGSGVHASGCHDDRLSQRPRRPDDA